MVNPIPNFAKNVWSKWNIRVFILTSLFLQIILTFLASFRKRYRSRVLDMLLWFTYLIADSTAIFCIGLISTKYGDEDTPIISNANELLLSFWAPFLLVHLGGPDNITAFALEDNQLWIRHLLGLLVQVCLTSYVFLLTLPKNMLWLPTALVFLAGVIKFAQRTYSLRLASAKNFRQSLFPTPDPGPNYAKMMEALKCRLDAGLPAQIVTIPYIDEPFPIDVASQKTPYGKKICDVEVLRDAYSFFSEFKGLVVDMIFSFRQRDVSRRYFLGQITALDALRVIEVELNLFYEAFYTKAPVICNKRGFWIRVVSVFSVVAALVLFNAFDQKRGCDEFDVEVTYTLLYGAVAMDLVSLFMLIFSAHSLASFYSLDYYSREDSDLVTISKLKNSIFGGFLKLKRSIWIEQKLKNPTWLHNKSYKILCRQVLGFRWFEYSISGFNLISYCLHKRNKLDDIIDRIGFKEVVEPWKYEKKQPLLQRLWIFIFRELERKSAEAYDFDTMTEICCSRGDRVIQNRILMREDLNKLMPYVDPNSVSFDECLILWHIATDLLFYADKGHIAPRDDAKKRDDDALDLKKGHISDDGKNDNERTDAQDLEKGNIGERQKNNEIAPYDHVKKGGAEGQKKNENAGHKDDPVKSDFEDVDELRDFSKLLSDYLLYLVIMQPTMVSAVRGIVEIRYQDTCAEASNYFHTRQMMEEGEKKMEAKGKKREREEEKKLQKSNTRNLPPDQRIAEQAKNMCKRLYDGFIEFIKRVLNSTRCCGNFFHCKEESKEQEACRALSDVYVDFEFEPSVVKGGSSKSLLFNACKLASVIDGLKLKETDKWKMVAQVWVELLSYAAANCIPITHVQQLSNGGEFLSLVWLLMTHLGLSKQFQFNEIRGSKLIPAEEED